MVDLIVTGAQIYTEQGLVTDAVLAVEKNKIHAIERGKKISAKETVTFPKNYVVVPGFIDLHVHGANGSDVMDGDAAALTAISKALAQEGTTAFLATTMTAAPAEIEKALIAVGQYMPQQDAVAGAKILGVHLEGPFLSPKKVGAQRADEIILPDIRYIQEWQKKSAQSIRLVTLAPELQRSLEFIQQLRAMNIIASIGHTDATYEETAAAIAAGCSHVTHLFNAMRGVHQREPGPAVAALLAKKVSTELIADGVHLHPAMLQLTLQMKGAEKIVLVTDAMRAKCMRDGKYDLGGQAVVVTNGVARLADGTLAGSTLKMSAALKNILQFTQCDLQTALRFVTENPARVLNIFQHKGSLAVGKDADFVVLDDEMNVVLTVSEGRVVFSGS